MSTQTTFTESVSGEKRILALSNLRDGAFGMTAAFGASLAEAAAVCLEDQHHTSGVRLPVEGDCDVTCLLFWDQATDRMKRTWADRDAATEHGAYGLAVLLVRDLKNMTVGERSYRGNGFDFWVGATHDGLFQRKTRLEISGIRNGSDGVIRARLDEKIARLHRYKNPLPALIVVIEFGKPRSRLVNYNG
jgi:hypothetical protein